MTSSAFVIATFCSLFVQRSPMKEIPTSMARTLNVFSEQPTAYHATSDNNNKSCQTKRFCNFNFQCELNWQNVLFRVLRVPRSVLGGRRRPRKMPEQRPQRRHRSRSDQSKEVNLSSRHAFLGLCSVSRCCSGPPYPCPGKARRPTQQRSLR